MKIASWNVNSVRARLTTIEQALKMLTPDIVCLQEIKCLDQAFPGEPFENLGYQISTYGQKSYNGVAILSKYPFETIEKGLPNYPDEQARYLEVEIITQKQNALRIASLYCPNGNPCPGPKFDYKRDWLNAFYQHASQIIQSEQTTLLAGDYNIIPNPGDVYNPEEWLEDALFKKEIRACFKALKWLGYKDAFDVKINQPHHYTFWDYQKRAWQNNQGLRIDHILASPKAADALESLTLHKEIRELEKPSDHVPICAEFDL